MSSVKDWDRVHTIAAGMMHLLAHCPMGLLERVLAFVAAHKRRPPRSTALGLALYKERRLKKPFADATPAQRARLQKALDGAPTMAKKSISKSHQVGTEKQNKQTEQKPKDRENKTENGKRESTTEKRKQARSAARSRPGACRRARSSNASRKTNGPGPRRARRTSPWRDRSIALRQQAWDVRCQPAVGQGQHRPGRAGHR